MPEMIATSEIEYPPGKHRKPGDRFEVEEKHTELLKTLGRAKLAPEPGEYMTRDLTAAPAGEYSTRDMVQKRKRGRPRKGSVE